MEEEDTVEGLCQRCGVFGPIFGMSLCSQCYNDYIDEINSPQEAYSDSCCEIESSSDDSTEYYQNQNAQRAAETLKKNQLHVIIDQKMKYHFKGSENLDCAICLEKIQQGDEVVTLPCAHTFHFKCVYTLLQTNDRCPFCREPICTDRYNLLD